MKSRWVFFCLIGMALLLSLQGCVGVSYRNKLQNMQYVAKKMMDKEAQRTVVKLFNAKYDPNKGQLVEANEIHKWISKNKIKVKSFPYEVQKAINDKSVIGLLVPEFIALKTEKTMGNGMYASSAIFLPIWDPESVIGGWWISDGVPCDGDSCLNCSGCFGYNSFMERFETCVCTNSCKNCRSCPQCK